MYDLIGSGGYQQLNITAWCLALELAEKYGWKPTGTKLSSDPDGNWDSNYFGNDGQLVTRQDANRFAAALQSALDDIPEQDAMQGKVDSRGGILDVSSINPYEFFSGPENKRLLRALVVFCRKGAFTIN